MNCSAETQRTCSAGRCSRLQVADRVGEVGLADADRPVDEQRAGRGHAAGGELAPRRDRQLVARAGAVAREGVAPRQAGALLHRGRVLFARGRFRRRRRGGLAGRGRLLLDHEQAGLAVDLVEHRAAAGQAGRREGLDPAAQLRGQPVAAAAARAQQHQRALARGALAVDVDRQHVAPEQVAAGLGREAPLHVQPQLDRVEAVARRCRHPRRSRVSSSVTTMSTPKSFSVAGTAAASWQEKTGAMSIAGRAAVKVIS